MNKSDIKVLTDLANKEVENVTRVNDKGCLEFNYIAYERIMAIQLCTIRLLKNKVGFKDE